MEKLTSSVASNSDPLFDGFSDGEDSKPQAKQANSLDFPRLPEYTLDEQLKADENVSNPNLNKTCA